MNRYDVTDITGISVRQDQVERIRDSFSDILHAADSASMLFYERLFEIAPETRAMFRDDVAVQRELLIASLARIVTGLSHFNDVQLSLEALGQRHVGFGVCRQHYEAVGEAFFYMIERVGGSRYDHAIEEAWHAAYALVAKTMIAASYDDDKQFGA